MLARFGRYVWALALIVLLTLVLKMGLQFFPVPLARYAKTLIYKLPAGLTLRSDDLILTWRYWGRPFEIVGQSVEASYVYGGTTYHLSAKTMGLTLSWWSLLRGAIHPSGLLLEELNYDVEGGKAPSAVLPGFSRKAFTDNVLPLMMSLETVTRGMSLEISSKATARSPWSLRAFHRRGGFILEGKFWGGHAKTRLAFEGPSLRIEGQGALPIDGGISLLDIMLESKALTAKTGTLLQGMHFQVAWALIFQKENMQGQIVVKGRDDRHQKFLEGSVRLKNDAVVCENWRFKTPQVGVRGKAHLSMASLYPWEADVWVDPLGLPTIFLLWPDGIAEAARTWMSEHISQAMIGAHWQANGQLAGEHWVKNNKGRLLVASMDLCPLEGMPVLKNLKGDARFDATQMDIRIESGSLDEQRIQKGRVHMTGLDGDNEAIKIQTTFQGPLQNLCQILSRKPIDYLGRYDLPTQSARGRHQTVLTLSFPLKTTLDQSEIVFGATSQLTNVTYTYPLMGDMTHLRDGKIKMTLDPQALKAEGSARVWDRPVSLWVDHLLTVDKGTRLGAGMTVDSWLLKKWGLDFLQNWLPQTFTGGIIYHPYQDQLSFDLDLAETPVVLTPFWIKLKGVPMQIKADWSMRGLPALRQLTCSIDNLRIVGDLLFTNTWLPKKIDLHFSEPKKNNAVFTLEASDTGWVGRLKGECLDLSGLSPYFKKFVSTEGASNFLQKGRKIALKGDVDKLVVAEGAPAIYDAHLVFDGVQTEQDFLASYLFFRGYEGVDPKPSQGKKKKQDRQSKNSFFVVRGDQDSFRVEANDAGYLLRALGLWDAVYDGALVLDIGPQDEHGKRTGQLVVQNFFLAQTSFAQRFLFTILSPTSFGQLFTGSRMPFQELKVTYAFDDGILDIERGIANSLDTSFTWKGWLDFNHSKVNVRGNVVPLYFINRVLRNVPVLGPVLAGGKDDGLFATRFYVKGDLWDPSVAANPIQILAPGALKQPVDAIEDKQQKASRRKTRASNHAQKKQDEIIAKKADTSVKTHAASPG